MRLLYAGSNWLKKQQPKRNISELGMMVADLLGELFHGIYHLSYKDLYAANWENEDWIEFRLAWKSLSTFDYDELTRLVILAHECRIRIEIQPRSAHSLTLLFHRRDGGGKYYKDSIHPTLTEAMARFQHTHEDLEQAVEA